MQITQVDLENVKSYVGTSIPFAAGTNAICGLNGAGKSTLLESIGFTLFDYLAVPQADFVREGEKTAAVTVHVIGEDERLYHVVRKCGGSNQYYVYDPELEQKLTDSKRDTVAWLREFLGVEETADLSALFRDAVGVPQGLLTAAFLDRPGNRKNIFNPLLRVDEYEVAWTKIRESRSWLEKRIHEQETGIAGLEAEAKALPDWRTKVSGLDADIAAGEKRQGDLAGDLAEVTRRRTALETTKTQLADLEQGLLQAEAQVKTLSARLEEAQAALIRAADAQAVVAETEAGYQAYLAAQKGLAALEAQRKERDRLQSAQQQLERDLAAARERLGAWTTELEHIAQAETEMEDLRPRVEAQARIEAELAEAQRAADRLVTAQNTLAQEQTRLRTSQARLAEVQAGLAERTDVEGQLAALLAELAPLNAQWEALAEQLASRRAEQAGFIAQQAQAATRVTEAEQALAQDRTRLNDLAAKLIAARQGLEARTQAEKETEALRTALAQLETHYAALTARAAAQQAELDQLRAQIEVLLTTEDARCPVCKGPLTREHRAELLGRHQTDQAQLKVTLAEARAEQKQVEESRREQRQRLKDLEDRVKSLPRPEETEDLAAQLSAQQQAVTGREGALAREQAEIETLKARQTALAQVLSDLEAQQAALEADRSQKQQAVDALERHSRTLPRPDEANALVTQIARQEETVSASAEAVAALAAAPDDVARLGEALAALNDPRRRYQRAADIAARRQTVAESHAGTSAHIAGLDDRNAHLAEALQAFAGLDANISAQRAARDEHEPAYQRYLQHVREAGALAERQATVADLAEQVRAAEVAQVSRQGARDAIAREYDAAALADLISRHDALREMLAGLKVQLQEQRKQQAEALAEIERLVSVEAEHHAARGEHADLQAVLALLDHFRQVLRDAGPEITRALVEIISLQADRLYADIMQEYSSRLCWTADYDIVLTTEGRDRAFQQLSGGEQMSAALAVRLALLREVSTIDVAFFDEPTANLDQDRRANLARQILNVKGFAQLFVISHDDTFEQDTDYAVRVEKHNGVSRACPESVERVEV